jgi:hypothetical protein
VVAVLEEHFESPEDLLRALGRRESRWSPSPTNWIFRGQADADWELQPRAFRPGAWEDSTIVLPANSNEDQMKCEWLLVHSFLQDLDTQGLPLPVEAVHDWMSPLRIFDTLHVPEGTLWPPKEIMPLFALAQHYGLPTRLLDWTQHPLVGAYFAAVDAAGRRAQDTSVPARIAVWALRNDAPLSFFDRKGKDLKRVAPHLEIVRLPRFPNPNLRAQAGLFTVLIEPGRAMDAPATLFPLEVVLEQRDWKDPILRKLTLENRWAGRLLRLLADEWVSATHLYPGIEGVVKGIHERKLWHR